jgi:hypothetical protein
VPAMGPMRGDKIRPDGTHQGKTKGRGVHRLKNGVPKSGAAFEVSGTRVFQTAKGGDEKAEGSPITIAIFRTA